MLASASDGKVQIVVAVTPDLTGRVTAGQIVKEIAPIVGGGRPPRFRRSGWKAARKDRRNVERDRIGFAENPGKALPASDETLRPPRYASVQSRAGFALVGGSR